MHNIIKGIAYFIVFNLIFLANPLFVTNLFSAVTDTPVGQVTGVGSVTLTDSGKTIQVASLSKLVYPKSQIKTNEGEAFIKINKNVFNVFKNSSGTINSSKSIDFNLGKLAFNISPDSDFVIQTPISTIKPAKVMLTSTKPMAHSSNSSGMVTVLPDGKTIVSAAAGNLMVKNIITGEEKILAKGSSLTLSESKTMILAQVDDGSGGGGGKTLEMETNGQGQSSYSRNLLYGTIFGGAVIGGVIYAVTNNDKTPSR